MPSKPPSDSLPPGSSGPDRNIKRRKAGDPMSNHSSGQGNYPPYPQHHMPPHQQPYSQPGPGYNHSGGPPQQYQMPHQQHGGYMYNHGQQQPPPYGSQPPSQPWQQPAGQQPVFRQPGTPSGPPAPPKGGQMSPDRNSHNWGGYRGPPPQPPPQMGGMSEQGRGHSSKMKQSHQSPTRSGPKSGATAGGPPNGQPSQYQPWHHGQQPPQHWPQQQWGGNPNAQGWQHGGMHHPSSSKQGPPPHMGGVAAMPPQMMQGQPHHRPPHMQQPPGNQNMWSGNGSGPNQMGSPARPSGGYPGRHPGGMSNGPICEPIGEGDPRGGQMDMMMMNPGMDPSMHDDDRSKGMGDGSSASKDKNRGSYRCGRCGAPKKGHICPYQPKLKRRPDESPPEMRNAAVQVEMDEFMVLRRLNIRIQGFPESYACEPHMHADLVGAEPHPPRPMGGVDAGVGGSLLEDMPGDSMQANMGRHVMPDVRDVRPSRDPPESDMGMPGNIPDEANSGIMEPSQAGTPV